MDAELKEKEMKDQKEEKHDGSSSKATPNADW